MAAEVSAESLFFSRRVWNCLMKHVQYYNALTNTFIEHSRCSDHSCCHNFK